MIYSTSKPALLATFVILLLAGTTNAAMITLLNGTATLSQTMSGPHSPDLSVDGDFTITNNGWAIATPAGNPIDAAIDQTAVWETAVDVNTSAINFAMLHNFTVVEHLIGRFRWSVTSDDRSLFADGMDNGGAVTANWTVLTNPVSTTGPAGLSFNEQGDNSILVSGTVPNTGTYNIQYEGTFINITGIRLEVLEDPSLPLNGPGFAPTNGNFVLTEIVATSADLVPEPATIGVLMFAGLACVTTRRNRRTG